jgi:hypothetical protein
MKSLMIGGTEALSLALIVHRVHHIGATEILEVS